MARSLLNRLSFRLVIVAIAPALLVSAALAVPMIELRREQLLAQAAERVVQAGRTTEAIYAERMATGALLARLLADRVAYVQQEQAGDSAALWSFVRGVREQTLFDLVTLVDADGAVLAQDGAAHLWRGDGDGQHVWGDPRFGLVGEFHAPVPASPGPARAFVGSFAWGADTLASFRQRTGLEQSLLVAGELVATSYAPRGREHVSVLDGAPEPGAQALPYTAEVRIDGADYLARYKPLRGADQQPVAMFELLLPLDPVHDAQRQATLLLLVITLLAVLAASLLGYTLARWVAAPIRQLGWASAAIGRGELRRGVRVQGPAEVVALGEQLEAMRAQLAATRQGLAEEKERYANILESIGDAVITLDAAGRITALNGGAERLLGWSRAAAVGRALRDTMAAADGRDIAPSQIPLGAPARLALRGPDGQPRTVAAARTPLLGQPESAHEYVVLLRDVSDDVAVAQLKEEFLANVTHEFQTPLAALSASLELLREEEAGLTAGERRDLLDAVHLGARRLQHLVTNLLDSASIQAGYFRVEPELAELEPLVEAAVETVRPLARQRGQTIAVEAPGPLPLIYADEPRVVQALVNLLSNASKFGPVGDTLRLHVAVGAEQVRVAVTDHGPGVPAARRAHLYERFLRPGPQTVRAQGAGLGLAIARAIVERHGGAIEMLTAEGRGTTFAFSLRRAGRLLREVG